MHLLLIEYKEYPLLHTKQEDEPAKHLAQLLKGHTWMHDEVAALNIEYGSVHFRQTVPFTSHLSQLAIEQGFREHVVFPAERVYPNWHFAHKLVFILLQAAQLATQAPVHCPRLLES